MLSAMGELLSIGRFGKEAQLTPRQLRYYHALGLLIPAAVDPHSGYRYYAEAQLASAELIALLRSVDMPVAEIQLLLTDRSPANTGAVFERLRASVERSLERAREILDQIDQMEKMAMPPEQKATYAYEAFSPDAQQALLRAQSLAEEARHPVIGVAHLMAAVAEDLGSSPDAIMQAASMPEPGPGQPMPGPEVQVAIANAFRAAGVTAPGSTDSGVSTRHLALGCLDTADGRTIAGRLGLRAN
jgi:DNA-binding transcriptional MerR regulator